MLQAIIQLTAKDVNVKSTLDSVKSSMSGFGQSMAGQFTIATLAADAFKKVLHALGDAMLESVSKSKEYVVLGKRLNMSAEEAAKLSRAAEIAGVQADSLGRGFLTMQKWANDALSNAHGKAGMLAQKLGLNNDELNKIRNGGVEAMAVLKEKMAAMNSEGEESIAWEDVLGKRLAYQLMPVLEKSSEEMKGMAENMIVMDQATIENLAAIKHSWGDLVGDFNKGAGELMSGLGPIIHVLIALGNALMPIIHILGGLAVATDVAAEAFATLCLWFVKAHNWMSDEKWDTTDLEKTIDGLEKRANYRAKKILDSIGQDFKNVGENLELAGGPDAANFKTPEEMKAEKEAADKRAAEYAKAHPALSEEEKKEADKYRKEREEKQYKEKYANSTDKERVGLLDEELKILDEKMSKFDELHRQTKEFMVLEDERTALIDKQAKLKEKMQREEEKGVVKMSLLNDKFNKYMQDAAIKRMKDRGVTEQEIYKQTMAQQWSDAKRTYEELAKMNEDASVTEDEKRKKREELLEIYKKADEATIAHEKIMLSGTGVKGDSLQAVGGGGAIQATALDISKDQLEVMRDSYKRLQDIYNALQVMGFKPQNIVRPESTPQ